MKIRSTLIFSGVLAVGSLLSGCGSENPHGNVYRQWSSRMSEMGIFPVYPPREDIVVGDVYALPLHPYDTAAVGYIGGLGNAGIHVEYLGDTSLGWSNLLAKLEKYYQMRPYPADSTNNLVVGTNMPLTMIASYPNDTQRTNAFNSGSVARLRQVSFPDFNITHVDQESLSAVIPIEAVMTSLNFNRSDIKSVHFSIPHAESYGLTTENLLQEALHDPPQFMVTTNGVYLRGDTNGVISVAGAQMAYSMFRDILYHVSNNSEYKIPKNVRRHMEQSATRMNDKIYLALISEVFFARSMDIMIDRKTAAGASVSAKPISSSELQQLKTMGLTALHTRTNTTITTNTTVSASSTNGFVGTKAEMIDVTEGDTALDLAKKLRDLETPDGIGNIGGSVRVLSVSASSIGLRRTFLRPICVGVRGIIVKIDVTHPEDILGSGKREWMRVETSGN